MRTDKKPEKLSESIAKLIDKLTLMEIDEVKNLMWKALAYEVVRNDAACAEEFVNSDRRELAAFLESKKRWSPGVVQDAMAEFWTELQALTSGEIG